MADITMDIPRPDFSVSEGLSVATAVLAGFGSWVAVNEASVGRIGTTRR
jgi:hypothetical protein